MSNAKPYRDSPPSMSTNDLIITETWHEVPLSREHYINPMGVWLKRRFGYFSFWPNQNTEPLLRQRTSDTSNVPNRKQVAGIGLAFWMPSQCWPERDRLSVTFYRPGEDRWPAPGNGEYIVETRLSWPCMVGTRARHPSTKSATNHS